MPSPCRGTNSLEHMRHFDVAAAAAASAPARSRRRRLYVAMYSGPAFLRHGSEQYLACGTAVEKSAPHIAHATLRMRAATFMALLRAADARMRAA